MRMVVTCGKRVLNRRWAMRWRRRPPDSDWSTWSASRAASSTEPQPQWRHWPEKLERKRRSSRASTFDTSRWRLEWCRFWRPSSTPRRWTSAKCRWRIRHRRPNRHSLAGRDWRWTTDTGASARPMADDWTMLAMATNWTTCPSLCSPF